MTRKGQILLAGDFDGSEADGTAGFGLDGAEDEIDLNAEHSEELRSALGKYVTHARKVGGAARRGGRVAGRAVRERAKAQGIDVKDRGRVPAELVAGFKAADGK